MAAILEANTNYPAGVSAPGSLILSADSGNIVAQGTSGKPQFRLTTGLQQQATKALVCDNTAGVVGNAILPPSLANSTTGASIYQVVKPATLTNSSVSTTGNVSTATFLAVNSFVAGMTVKFASLTNATALNGLCGVVTATGLSGAGFQATLTGFTAGTVTSATETGTATLNYFAYPAMLSVASETK
jgi:hypothetical protein